MITLSICIPTYKRPECIEKSLENYLNIIKENGFEDKVEICLSDNSPDSETEKIAASYMKKIRHMRYSKNKENVGYDANVIKVVSMSSGEYFYPTSDENIMAADRLADIMRLLGEKEPDMIYCIWRKERFLHSLPNELPDPSVLLRWFLSPEGVRERVITHISMFVVRKSLFDAMKAQAGERISLFYNLSFVQNAFILHGLNNSKKVLLYKQGLDPYDLTPKMGQLYLPSDIANVLYYKYFFTVKHCADLGLISASDYAYFHRNFLPNLFFGMLKLRSHLDSFLYPFEAEKMVAALRKVEDCYTGFPRALLGIWEKLLFIKPIPYHLLYKANFLFNSRVLGKKCFDGLSVYRRFYQKDPSLLAGFKQTEF
ncbi:Glycosyl transferase family 2 [Candidatus Anstonella stagnisolia]|nr:Glycosyl transferase family 2 [Candidatus Anstonella stagnisolia]